MVKERGFALQVDHSSGFSAYLPSFVPALWQKPSPILELAFDKERQILYTRSQKSSIEVSLRIYNAATL